MSKIQPSSRPIVFISHSHRDCHVAVELQGAIEENGAETYLDQERIEPGARLTKKIIDLMTLLDFQENSGRYFFNYAPNPHALYILDLPDGTFPTELS